LSRGASRASTTEKTREPSPPGPDLLDDLDDGTAAAITNPGVSSFAAYAQCPRLKIGEIVLINGATGTSGHNYLLWGRLAMQIAKHFGARTIMGMAPCRRLAFARAVLGNTCR
jgi:NADPH:quinone reductase-like Zn-dependent oxidoreductase